MKTRPVKFFYVFIENRRVLVQVMVYEGNRYIVIFTDSDTVTRYETTGFKVTEKDKQWFLLEGKVSILDADSIWTQISAQWDKPERQIDLPILD